MNRNLSIAALAALACGLAACNDPSPGAPRNPGAPAGPGAPESPGKQSSNAAPASQPVPPPQQTAKAGQSPQVQLEADMELSSKVKAALQEPQKGHVEVAANDGVVTLYGTVEAPSDKQRIALAAMGVEGVRSVVNNLVVLRGS
jgi:BON domain-containing protein